MTTTTQTTEEKVDIANGYSTRMAAVDAHHRHLRTNNEAFSQQDGRQQEKYRRLKGSSPTQNPTDRLTNEQHKKCIVGGVCEQHFTFELCSV